MKYFIDTSSLVKIYHVEDGSSRVLEIYNSSNTITISELSKIEYVSTIYRKYRENEISIETLNILIGKFQDDIESRYDILKLTSLVLEESIALIHKFAKQYSLKTQDSLQFAFFKAFCEKDNVFVCSDKKLHKLVELEGFSVLEPVNVIMDSNDN